MPEEKDPILQFFEYGHLHYELQTISYQFKVLAEWMVTQLPRNPERTVALRNLLLAKDAAVRAHIYKETQ